MLKLNQLININSEIVKEFEISLKILPDLLKSESKYTAELCFMYMNNTDFIKDSILDLVERENFYSANILYRSLIEHFLRFNYYFFNHALLGKTDSYSHKFRTALEFNDKISINKAVNSAKRMKGEKAKTNNQISLEIFNSKEDYKKYALEELENFAREISIKNIIDYTENHITNETSPPNDFLKNMIIQYSKLSSYVHGGMFAHREFINFAEDENKSDKLTVMFGTSIQISTFIKMYSFLILKDSNPNFIDHYFKISTLIMKLTPNYNCR